MKCLRFVLILFGLFFWTHAQSQDKVTIALWGDSKDNLDSACTEIASILLRDTASWDVQVHTGDFTLGGEAKDWERSLGYAGVKQLFVKGRFLMCTSNHDAEEKGTQSTKRSAWDRFTAGVLPVNDLDSSTHFYAWHRANVYVVFCDGFFTDSTTMQRWLDGYLEQVKSKDWLIGVWHEPAYALTYKPAYFPTCRGWLESLERHGGDFIFNGHAHQYIRTKPLLPDGTIDERAGMVTIINGTGGATWEKPAPMGPMIAYTPSEKSFPCITFLTFEGDTASLKTVDARPGKNLRVIDEWKWRR